MSQVSKLAVIFVNAPFDLNLNVTRLYAYIMSLSKLLKQELLNKLSFLNQPRNFQMQVKTKKDAVWSWSVFRAGNCRFPLLCLHFMK